jgi:uncharacterized protein (UPF0548 family)
VFERSIPLGYGEQLWRDVSTQLMSWGVKTRSGFAVEPQLPVSGGRLDVDTDFTLIARIGPFSVREPVRVVSTVESATRCGFAYGTLQGHPVSGEEAFILERDESDGVWLSIRSLTRAPRGWRRLGFPLVLLAQRWYRRRYLQALLPA